MGLFTATAGYLYMTHSVGNPSYAPVAALLCGGVPFLAIRAVASVLGDACVDLFDWYFSQLMYISADSLFICHQIDGEMGGGHCEEAKAAVSSHLFWVFFGVTVVTEIFSLRPKLLEGPMLHR